MVFSKPKGRSSLCSLYTGSICLHSSLPVYRLQSIPSVEQKETELLFTISDDFLKALAGAFSAVIM